MHALMIGQDPFDYNNHRRVIGQADLGQPMFSMPEMTIFSFGINTGSTARCGSGHASSR
jgi:hypothetical protein